MNRNKATEKSDSFSKSPDVDYSQESTYAESAFGKPNWKMREAEEDGVIDEKNEKKRKSFDLPFLLLTLIILMIGMIMVLSASFARSYDLAGDPMFFFTRQLTFAIFGVAMMFAVSFINTSWFSRVSLHFLVLSIVLLILLMFIGLTINGARRWLGFEFGDYSITFQPSELAKLAVIMAFAQMACIFGDKMKTFRYGVAPFASTVILIILLLYVQPHISAAIIIVSISAVMMIIGGTHIKWFLLAVLIGTALISALLLPRVIANTLDEEMTGNSVQQAVIDVSGNFGHAGARIATWLDPDADPLDAGFQTRQSLLAIGSGGFFGQGLGQSRQKFGYLPEEHNDFIFAIIGEELGFIGSMMILTLFALLIIRGYYISYKASNRYNSLIVFGITSLLALQVFFNVAVVTSLIPATGISLPFFSYGGTALVLQLIQMGMILAVSREINDEEPEEI